MTFIENIFNGFDPVLVDIIGISITLIVAFIIIKIVNYFLKKTGQRFDLEMTVIQVLQEIFKYTVIVIAAVMILNELGINVSALILSLGILGVAVGFAARDTLSNFIAGLFILGHKSFKVGDIIEVSDHVGTVTKMGFRVTILTTVDNKIINVPNSLFSTETYLNHTALDNRMVELAITIPYDVKMEDAIEFIIKKSSNLSWVLNDPKPQVMIQEFSELGLKANLNVWTNDPWNVTKYRSTLAREIKEYMEQKNA